ncbi:hypothetical protein EGR_10740 [Echinococcus granulosus]|uniref:Uncharacterized protein n=1 Tax=Echinococcus granulosus TaxID=6210 RepID=W6U7P7_ECHGR|nr:hypothetical protein EGR_10740 [Echinococcus granulosus]EUB54397.1 hypothetical protein EGR_10740 [Echinococcus granulosus]
MTSKFTLTTRSYVIYCARHTSSGRQTTVVVNLTGVSVIAVQQDFERRVHVDMIDARCVVTTTSKVATLDIATLSLEELSTHGVERVGKI